MTNEKALEIIENAHSTNIEMLDALCLAAMALEKQIPKKAIPCSFNSTWSKCPVCGDTYIDEYCGKCGQRLDWSM